MKLSEAIRLGAMLRPQAFNVWYEKSTDSTCAIGAAGEASGCDVEDMYSWDIFPKFPILEQLTVCPVTGSQLFVSSVVTQLNDMHRWTREAIADWVATIEPPETPPEPERTPVAVLSRGPDVERSTVGR